MAYKKVMAAAFAVTLFLAGCAGSTDKGTSPAAVPLKETMNPISVRPLVARLCVKPDICPPAGSRR